MTQDNKRTGTSLTIEAATTFNRRTLLKRTAIIGAAAALSPAYIKRSLASSGGINILCWTDELPNEVMGDFTKATGITVNKTPFSSNEEQINKLQATFGEGYDLCMPSFNRAPEFQFLEVLQRFDTNRMNMGIYSEALLKASTDLWTWDGLYHVPHVWGSEGMAWRTDKAELDYKKMSYGLIWDPEFAGKAQIRPVSGLLGLGLWLDATGKLPSNRMLDTYKDEATMRKIYSELVSYAIKQKAQIKQFWDSSDSTMSGFIENGCTIGQTWDGPVKRMAKAGKPVKFMAPQEGALAWIDGFAMSKAAANLDQVYAFFDYILKPEVAGKIATVSSYNSVVKGADEFVPEADKERFRSAYPDDALSKLWRYPSSPPWFITARNEYAEKFKVS
ncbi:extracellular solute-binding protein [Rhizobium rhizogenes]|uniref:extracellular solute-binding protein n=1 Tax=Rhizobium rhizogenes TaxID=359 RepID=UPI0009B8D16C|nr:extracellular solute-binding protein [Rhizobium rhizogenes]